MSAHLSLNLLNELRKIDEMQCNKTGAQMLDSIYHIITCEDWKGYIMDVITLRCQICKPLVVYRFYARRYISPRIKLFDRDLGTSVLFLFFIFLVI